MLFKKALRQIFQMVDQSMSDQTIDDACEKIKHLKMEKDVLWLAVVCHTEANRQGKTISVPDVQNASLEQLCADLQQRIRCYLVRSTRKRAEPTLLSRLLTAVVSTSYELTMIKNKCQTAISQENLAKFIKTMPTTEFGKYTLS